LSSRIPSSKIIGEMSMPPPLGKSRRIGARTGSVKVRVTLTIGLSSAKLSQDKITETNTTSEYASRTRERMPTCLQ